MGKSPKKILTFKKDDGTWRYSRDHNSNHRTAGAFRAVKVADLLKRNPEVVLYEWSHITYPLSKPNPLKKVRYVAVSHVWDFGFEVDQQMNTFGPGQHIHIAVTGANGPETKKISWTGLVQVAKAVEKQNRSTKYFWLDFLCLDQVERPNDSEKKLLICIMADIYTYADAVVTMIGGIGAVQGVHNATAWMDRAWTLQEAVLNRGITWIYVTWPSTWSKAIKDSRGKYFTFKHVELDNFLIPLTHLLDIVDKKLPSTPNIVILDGKSPKAGDVPRHALRAALAQNRMVRYAGIWRSMFLRTSSHQVDVVYSLMACFKQQIDPYRNNRDAEYLFNDLVRKTAALENIGPAWLTIGGVHGPSALPRNKESRIIPKFPDFSDNTLPRYHTKWIGHFVDTSANYIKRFDINFITHSHPHVINAYMLPIKVLPTPGRKKGTAKLQLRSMVGNCYFRGNLAAPAARHTKAVYIGLIGDMKDSGVDFPLITPKDRTYKGNRYFLFVEYVDSKRRWDVVGDGVFIPSPKQGWVRSRRRWIFTVGNHAQEKVERWPTEEPRGLDRRTSSFKYHSYGIVPLPDVLVRNPVQRDIEWFGYKYDKPPRKVIWRKYHINFDFTTLSDNLRNQRLVHPTPLYLTSAHTEIPPRSNQEPTPYKLTAMGSLPMVYSYAGWPKSKCVALLRAGVEGILVPETANGQATAPYWVHLWFGKQMIYIRTMPHRRTPPAFRQLYVLPYGGYGGQALNSRFIQRPVAPSLPLPVQLPPLVPQPVLQTAPQRWQALGYIPTDEYNQMAARNNWPGVRSIPYNPIPYNQWSGCP